MRVAVFNTKRFDREGLERALAAPPPRGAPRLELTFFEARLHAQSAKLAADHEAVCAFVSDQLDAACLEALAAHGVRMIALRSAGYNHVDLVAAHRLDLVVMRVPAYSPHAVAEHAVALLLTLNRKLHRAAWRVREHNFSLDGLLGFDLVGKTVGVVGLGQIGSAFARIMGPGFGCRLLGNDPAMDRAPDGLPLELVDLPRLLSESDVISLHCPLTPQTRHLIDAAALARMKPLAVLINTGRGALVDTGALIAALKRRALGGVALDVYEEEEGVFFEDLSDQVLDDDVLARLLTFPNVLVTAHQGFFTREAVANICATTLANLYAFATGSDPEPGARL